MAPISPAKVNNLLFPHKKGLVSQMYKKEEVDCYFKKKKHAENERKTIFFFVFLIHFLSLLINEPFKTKESFSFLFFQIFFSFLGDVFNVWLNVFFYFLVEIFSIFFPFKEILKVKFLIRLVYTTKITLDLFPRGEYFLFIQLFSFFQENDPKIKRVLCVFYIFSLLFLLSKSKREKQKKQTYSFFVIAAIVCLVLSTRNPFTKKIIEKGTNSVFYFSNLLFCLSCFVLYFVPFKKTNVWLCLIHIETFLSFYLTVSSNQEFLIPLLFLISRLQYFILFSILTQITKHVTVFFLLQVLDELFCWNITNTFFFFCLFILFSVLSFQPKITRSRLFQQNFY